MRDGEAGSAFCTKNCRDEGVADVGDDIDLPSVGQMNGLEGAWTSGEGVFQKLRMQWQGFEGSGWG